MVHVELVGKLFEINLRSPQDCARAWFGSLWIRHFMTNEEVLFNPDAHLVAAQQIEAVQTLGSVAAWPGIRSGRLAAIG